MLPQLALLPESISVRIVRMLPQLVGFVRAERVCVKLDSLYSRSNHICKSNDPHIMYTCKGNKDAPSTIWLDWFKQYFCRSNKDSASATDAHRRYSRTFPEEEMKVYSPNRFICRGSHGVGKGALPSAALR
jgi:hypothetical protein